MPASHFVELVFHVLKDYDADAALWVIPYLHCQYPDIGINGIPITTLLILIDNPILTLVILISFLIYIHYHFHRSC